MKRFTRLLLVLMCVLAAPAHAQIQDEVRGMFNVFAREANARSVASVGQMLLDSQEFSWQPQRGAPVKGRDSALAYLNGIFRGTWRIEANMPAMAITTQGTTSAQLQVPVRLTFGEAGKPPESDFYLQTQVYVSTPIGWRIASITMTPLQRQ
ncbi:MAG: hypothetical protein EBT83_06425 [Betaproteobacteria bacterium]|jgi:hypothetical protein|nr:hypothetical protein [Betaproteobacteria bacterium]